MPMVSTVIHQPGGKFPSSEDAHQSSDGIGEFEELPSTPEGLRRCKEKNEDLTSKLTPASLESARKHAPSKNTPQTDDIEIELPELLPPIQVGSRHRIDKSEDPTSEEVPDSPKSLSKSTPALENLSEESLAEEEIKSLVLAQKFCISVDSEEKAEQLLNYDRPKFMNVWYYFRYIIAADPLCSTNPNRIPIVIDPVQISPHEFFQSKSIEIPIKTGVHGYREVVFRHIQNQNTIRKRVLECECEIEDPEKEVQNICVEGRIVSLSRGVGGNTSFFVYSFDATTGTFNAIAHICF